jgi:predicted AlkP superfamily phosphohydrolase/phosphomutase/cytochrome c-type biogenesis protein CcmH/NrfG
VKQRASWFLAVLLLASFGVSGVEAAGTTPIAAAADITPPRVLLIGIDGADPVIVERLIAKGKVPTFARLKREGAFGRLRSQEPLLSPIVWTTIATGRRPQDHGILDFVEVNPDGSVAPITSGRRRVPALWNVATDFGKTSGFVGWYASFPAEKVLGFEVSDRLGFHQVRSARSSDGATWPERLTGDLRARFGEPSPDLAATKARFLPQAAALTEDGTRRLSQLSKIYATSEYYRRILPALQKEYRADLLGVYFEGIDTSGHLFMEDASPRRPEVSAADYLAFSEVVDRYYEYQDEVLADLLKLEGPNTVTLVVSDHGFKSEATRPKTSGRADTGLAPLWHRLHGVVFVHGAGVHARSLPDSSIYDVAPTVFALLGIPLSRELSGRALVDAFRPGALPAASRSVDRYAFSPPPRRPEPVPPDSEALAKLRALGYLSGSGPPAHDADGRTAASYLSEGLLKGQDGDGDGALRAYGKAVGLDPRNVSALVTAASIYIRRREFPRAKELLDRAVSVEPEGFWVHVQRASLELQQGRLPEARRELSMARRADDQLPSLYLLTARLERASGNRAAALTALDRADALTDLDEMTLEIGALRAEIRTESGDLPGAEAALRALEGSATPDQLAEPRGDLVYARHDGPTAASFYRKAIEGSPKSSRLERKLGETLAVMKAYRDSEAAFARAISKAATPDERESAYGDLSLLLQREQRESDVVATLRRGVAELPGSASLWALLGAAYGRLARFDESIGAYEKSVEVAPTALSCKTLAALVFERRKDRPRAVALWKQSLDLDNNQPDVRGFLRAYGDKSGPPSPSPGPGGGTAN